MRQGLVILLLAACIGWAGCRKPEPDTVPPRITVLQPFDGTAIHVLDTLVVQLEVSDETGLQNVLVELVSAEGQVLHPAEAFPLCTTATTLTFGYALDNIHIPGGSHFLRISAFDAEQRKLEFVELNVFEVPRTPLAVAWLEADGNTLVRTTPALQDPAFDPLPAACDQLVADRWNRRWIAASNDALVFSDAEAGTLLQSVDLNVQNPTSHALHWDAFSKRVYHAVDTDLLRAYSTTGQPVTAFDLGAELTITGLTSTANHLALAGTLGTGQGVVLFYEKNSGALFQSAALPDAPTVLISGDERVAVLLENGEYRVYDAEGNSLFSGDISGLSGSPIHASKAHPEGHSWLVTDANGTGAVLDILNFSATPASLPSGTQHTTTDWTSPAGLRYYQTSDALWSGFPAATPSQVASLSGGIPSVAVLMNK
ncbi:MAG: hypothetical protein ACON34_04805 [Flavobacteriales bacterium]